MQNRTGLLTVFIVFFLLSLVIIFFFRQQLFPVSNGIFEYVTAPFQHTFTSIFGGFVRSNGETKRLETENRALSEKIIDQNELVKEVKALRDQYDLEIVPPKALVPADVVGFKSFIPGVSMPEEIIVNKGSKQGIAVGQTVIVGRNVIGIIEKVSPNRALVALISNKKQAVTAKTEKTDALGISRGKGSGMLVLENVVLADSLTEGDFILTKGDETLEGKGYPPDLIIGRIASVDKKASNLFQTAEIKSLINFSKLDTVFIITNNS